VTGRGFDVVSALQQARPGARIVMLTGYGNIATAVAAVKAGAIDYLPKPADADAVERALLAQEDGTPEPPEDPMSADRVRWEHIQRVFELCDPQRLGNRPPPQDCTAAPCSASCRNTRPETEPGAVTGRQA